MGAGLGKGAAVFENPKNVTRCRQRRRSHRTQSRRFPGNAVEVLGNLEHPALERGWNGDVP